MLYRHFPIPSNVSFVVIKNKMDAGGRTLRESWRATNANPIKKALIKATDSRISAPKTKHINRALAAILCLPFIYLFIYYLL